MCCILFSSSRSAHEGEARHGGAGNLAAWVRSQGAIRIRGARPEGSGGHHRAAEGQSGTSGPNPAVETPQCDASWSRGAPSVESGCGARTYAAATLGTDGQGTWVRGSIQRQHHLRQKETTEREKRGDCNDNHISITM